MKSLTLKEKKSIEKLFKEGRTYKTIGQKLGRSPSFISKICRMEFNAPLFNQSLSIESSIFDVIDSAEKAYWVGYLCCRGTCHLDKNSTRFISKRIEDLDRFLGFLGVENNENEPKRVTRVIRPYGKEIWVLNIVSEMMARDLTKSGIWNADFSSITPEYKSHFIRGVLDAGASISAKRKSKSVLFFSNLSLLQWIQKVLADISIQGILYYEPLGKSKLGVYQKDSLLRLIEFIYERPLVHSSSNFLLSEEIKRLFTYSQTAKEIEE